MAGIDVTMETGAVVVVVVVVAGLVVEVVIGAGGGFGTVVVEITMVGALVAGSCAVVGVVGWVVELPRANVTETPDCDADEFATVAAGTVGFVVDGALAVETTAAVEPADPATIKAKDEGIVEEGFAPGTTGVAEGTFAAGATGADAFLGPAAGPVTVGHVPAICP